MRKDKWVPVTERLPEKDGVYLVTLQHADLYNVGFSRYEDGCFWHFEVTAWQSVPEPYRADNGEGGV